MAHIIVFGNEKGGSGKSTTAMHVLAGLLRSGRSAGAIDLDLRQQSLFRYLDNRAAFADAHGIALPMPARVAVTASAADSQRDAGAEEEDTFAAALDRLAPCDFVVIDCPGSHTRYASMAHAAADTLATPMNDSLVDFDLLARMDPATGRVLGPSIYAEMVWKARTLRVKAGLKSADWVVLRNRLSVTEARNKQRVGGALADLSKRIGFRLVPGLSERVIFRELFLQGLTLIDLADPATGAAMAGRAGMTMSQIAARQELRDLVQALRLPGVQIGF
jgi:chromosome partitioning protein